jgi:hypothetical protein
MCLRCNAAAFIQTLQKQGRWICSIWWGVTPLDEGGGRMRKHWPKPEHKIPQALSSCGSCSWNTTVSIIIVCAVNCSGYDATNIRSEVDGKCTQNFTWMTWSVQLRDVGC